MLMFLHQFILKLLPKDRVSEFPYRFRYALFRTTALWYVPMNYSQPNSPLLAGFYFVQFCWIKKDLPFLTPQDCMWKTTHVSMHCDWTCSRLLLHVGIELWICSWEGTRYLLHPPSLLWLGCSAASMIQRLGICWFAGYLVVVGGC